MQTTSMRVMVLAGLASSIAKEVAIEMQKQGLEPLEPTEVVVSRSPDWDLPTELDLLHAEKLSPVRARTEWPGMKYVSPGHSRRKKGKA